MPSIQIEKFMAVASKDAALLAILSEGEAAVDAERMAMFVRRVVDEAAKRGHHFTETELQEWLVEQAQMQSSDELTDAALGSVAGGSAGGAASRVTLNFLKAPRGTDGWKR